MVEVEASVSSLVTLAVSESDGQALRCELGARVPEYQTPQPCASSDRGSSGPHHRREDSRPLEKLSEPAPAAR